MADYKFISYELLDEGRVARILLNRPDQRNAQNRGLLVELDEAFKAAEEDDTVRVVILGGAGKMFSSGHDMGSKESIEEYGPGPNMHPTRGINGGTREGAENRMLQEWHYFFQNTLRWRNLRKITIAQVHGDVYAAGLMLMWACDLIVGSEEVQLRRRGRHPPRHVRRGVLRPPVGVRSPPGQGAAAHRRLDRASRRPTSSAWCRRSSSSTSSPTAPSSSRSASPRRPTMAALLIKESVNQTVDNLGFYNALQACFTLHQLNHSHWAEVREDKYPIGDEAHGVPSWRDAPPIVPMVVDKVRAE